MELNDIWSNSKLLFGDATLTSTTLKDWAMPSILMQMRYISIAIIVGNLWDFVVWWIKTLRILHNKWTQRNMSRSAQLAQPKTKWHSKVFSFLYTNISGPYQKYSNQPLLGSRTATKYSVRPISTRADSAACNLQSLVSEIARPSKSVRPTGHFTPPAPPRPHSVSAPPRAWPPCTASLVWTSLCSVHCAAPLSAPPAPLLAPISSHCIAFQRLMHRISPFHTAFHHITLPSSVRTTLHSNIQHR